MKRDDEGPRAADPGDGVGDPVAEALAACAIACVDVARNRLAVDRALQDAVLDLAQGFRLALQPAAGKIGNGLRSWIRLRSTSAWQPCLQYRKMCRPYRKCRDA